MDMCIYNPSTKDTNKASLGYILRPYLQLIKLQLIIATAIVKGQPKHQTNAHEKSKSDVNITLGLKLKALLKNKQGPYTNN